MKKRILLISIFLFSLAGFTNAKDISLIKLSNLIITNAKLKTSASDNYLYYRDLTNADRSVYLKLEVANWEQRFQKGIDNILLVKLKSKIINFEVDWRIIRYLDGKIVILTRDGKEVRATDSIELKYINNWHKRLTALKWR